MSTLLPLLKKLKKRNDADGFAGLLTQRVAPPESPRSHVPTLLPRHRVALSPMLLERFAFAGEWTNAAGAQTWLALSRIPRCLTDAGIQHQIGLRRTCWNHSLLATSAPGHLVLFGLDAVEMTETYLLWHGPVEPRIVVYTSGEEKVFDDLHAYVRWLLG